MMQESSTSHSLLYILKARVTSIQEIRVTRWLIIFNVVNVEVEMTWNV
jgi:hypothetical protein